MTETRRIDTPVFATGLLLIGFGSIFLLDQLDFAEVGHLIRRWWPMILVMMGVPKLLRPATMWSGLWLITVGAWLQIAHLRLWGLTYRTSWPLLLIALGAGMAVRAMFDAVAAPREDRRDS